LTELEECFPKIMFCRIHRFYLVNLTHVVKHERNRVFLPNGEVFPIGRAYERAFRDGLERFLRSGSDG
jgi:DNA-binding LytR/AlgR family response regulator